jgi:hypothetical protein
LQAVRESVRTAHRAVVDALTALKGVPNVDEFNGNDEEDEETATTTE